MDSRLGGITEWKMRKTKILLSLAALLCFTSYFSSLFKFYPLLVNILMFCIFAGSFLQPPCLIFRFACIQDKTIKTGIARKYIEAYCKKVTFIWCAFFVLNGTAALLTIFSGSTLLWALYNGMISYIIIGALLLGEIIVRRFVQQDMPKMVNLSQFSADSRKSNSIVCFMPSGAQKNWEDFLQETATLRDFIKKQSAKQFLLHCEDGWRFFTAFTALLQCKKEVLITANITGEYLKEIRPQEAGFLTDIDGLPDTVQLKDLLSQKRGVSSEVPKINAEEALISLFTSGTTGEPKQVRHRLKELEADNASVLNRFGADLAGRKFCATVTHHHIYGLLWALMLPFTAGAPFRSRRLEDPDEFKTFGDEPFAIMTVPAFLKRAAEILNSGDIKFHDPWILVSGGVLEREVGEAAQKIFGTFPIEGYGSTETNGIAHRQQTSEGLVWTAYKDVHLSLSGEGCLVVKSPHIEDPDGVVTGDLAELLDEKSEGKSEEGKKFLLKGRIDSIVKIEEKRISTTEVENRLLRSGLVKECAVTALALRSGLSERQILGAVVVLNEDGRAQFKDKEKFDMNKYFREYLANFFEMIVIPKRWRYVEAISVDEQGKRRKDEIQKLFSLEEDDTPKLNYEIQIKEVIERRADYLLADIFIPASTPYYDGHFPNYKLLPGVAQMEIVTELAAFYFSVPRSFSRARRIKFSHPITPDTVVRLEIKYSKEKSSAAFVISGAAEKTCVYSSGGFIYTTGAKHR